MNRGVFSESNSLPPLPPLYIQHSAVKVYSSVSPFRAIRWIGEASRRMPSCQQLRREVSPLVSVCGGRSYNGAGSSREGTSTPSSATYLLFLFGTQQRAVSRRNHNGETREAIHEEKEGGIEEYFGGGWIQLEACNNGNNFLILEIRNWKKVIGERKALDLDWIGFDCKMWPGT